MTWPELDREAASHVAHALERHRDGLARMGLLPPAGLVAVEQWARAIASQSGSSGAAGRRRPPECAHGRRMDSSELDGPLLVTRAEAAHLLGCSVRTVGRWIAAGELPTVTIAGAPRIERAALFDRIHGDSTPIERRA